MKKQDIKSKHSRFLGGTAGGCGLLINDGVTSSVLTTDD